ncbi:MAG TPA: hypothetical protein VFH51_15775, partial [Myxococcota bacterium]|nr:hypothetical protein [Myxococcota bacterium]
LSAPAGPLDVYAEAALFLGPAPSSIELAGDPAAGGDLGSLVRRQAHPAGTLQVSGGANYSFAWLDNRQATVGAEYFYNQLGHDDPRVYPLLIFLNAYQPFYTGRHYASFYFTAEGADAEKHTRYTFSGLSNISDRSYIARADFTWRVLTYLTLGAYGDVHWGTVGGEFNFALDTRRVSAPLTFRGAAVPAIVVQPAYFDVGLSVRMSF